MFVTRKKKPTESKKWEPEIIIIIIIIIQEKINVAFSPKWTSRTRYNVKKLT